MRMSLRSNSSRRSFGIQSSLKTVHIGDFMRVSRIGFTRKTLSKRSSSSITTELRLGSQSRSIGYLRFKGKRSLISGIGTRINLAIQSRGNLGLGSKITNVWYLTLRSEGSLIRVIRRGIKLSTELSLGSRLRSREVLSTLSCSTAHYMKTLIVFIEDNLTLLACVLSDRSRSTSYLLFFNNVLIH